LSQAFSGKYPLNINLFRSEEQVQLVRQSLKKRFRDAELADGISTLDKKVRSLQYNLEQHRKELNRLSKGIGKAVREEKSD